MLLCRLIKSSSHAPALKECVTLAARYSRYAIVTTHSVSIPKAIPANSNATIWAMNRHLSSLAPMVKHKSNPEMFCRQCEQAKDNEACTTEAICGKSPETSAAQDALVHVIKCVSLWCVAARKAGATSDDLHDANVWTLHAAFATTTNVNFSENSIVDYIHKGMKLKEDLNLLIQVKQGKAPSGKVADLHLRPDLSLQEIEDFGKTVGVLQRQEEMGNLDAFSLNEFATYGSKGTSAYACHANELGKMDEEKVMAPLHQIWAKLSSDKPDVNGLLHTVLKVGEINAAAIEILDSAHSSSFGVPSPTNVRLTAVEGKAILISGHDMKDMDELLKQTEGTGVNVYTHGEMMPAHMYPDFHKHKHLVGNYGTAWQAQKFEFAAFPGPVIVTSNCVLEPRRIYKERLFTMNDVELDGVQHINNRDFSKVIEKALAMDGFAKTVKPPRYHTVGYNHRAVVSLISQITDQIQSGNISRIFLIGGCDGTEWDRSYYTELAETTPENSLIVTMGCAKNRLIHSDRLRDLMVADGLPRILDMGQCNDVHSAIVLATELSKALNCKINELPLSICLSYMEQKSIAVLLTLLHLGVKNIRLGPKLPAYITPNVLNALGKKFNLMPLGEVDDDLKEMMNGK